MSRVAPKDCFERFLEIDLCVCLVLSCSIQSFTVCQYFSIENRTATTLVAAGRNVFAMLKEFSSLFLKHTAPTRRHLTPELLLRLVTPDCPLWAAPAHHSPFTDPYWGFYWPGGQATARYILDNPDVVKHRRVLDVGCGCGAGSIAAAVVKAKSIIANDIDPYAVMATQINAKLNHLLIETDTKDYINTACEDFDTILIGDMFYDEQFASVLFEWLTKLTVKDKTVLIGDPGRHGLTAQRRRHLELMAEYQLPAESRAENNGYTTASVWRLRI